MSGGRLLLNVVTGGESQEQRATATSSTRTRATRRCGEFLTIVRRLWAGETVTFEGEHLHVEGAKLGAVPDPVPEIYFGGSSPAAGTVAAKHADVYLTWGEPPAAVAEKIAWIRGLAEDEGREMRFGIRMHMITRDTSEEAWAEAHRLLDAIDDETIAKVQSGLRAVRVRGPAADARAQRRHARTTSRSTPTSGPASAWSAAAPAPPWWAATRRSPTGSRSTPTSASTSSCSPATRTSRSPTASARACCRCSPSAACGRTRRPRAASPSSVPFASGRRAALVSARVAVVVGNPRPRSRTHAAALHLATELAGRRRSWSSTSPTSGRPARLVRTPRGTRSSSRCGGRPGRRRQPDVQGDLHGPAQALPRPVPAGTACATWSRSR